VDPRPAATHIVGGVAASGGREWQRPLTVLSGVGPATAERLARLGITSLQALLWHLPRGYEDRRYPSTLQEAAASADSCVVVAEVVAHRFVGIPRGGGRSRRRGTLHLEISDGRRRAALLCFGRAYLARTARVGSQVVVSGHFTARSGTIAKNTTATVVESSDFELQLIPAGASAHETPWFGRIVPIYPLTDGVTQLLLRRLTLQLCASLTATEAASADGHGLLPLDNALAAMHWPEDFEQQARARNSVAFAELLTLQRSLQRRRPPPRIPRRLSHYLRERVVATLPFALTSGQMRALAEIDADLAANVAGSRLLQGDVGCGKTLVALLAACAVVEAGEQVAMIVPTELLARQHAETARRTLGAADINVACLVTASTSGSRSEGARSRAHLLAALARGDVDFVVGTHALLQSDVAFGHLGLVVVDEQHRFGVAQRRRLLGKGHNADLLLMSATPIPRSLALTVYGDLQRTNIRELPPGRQPVRTHLSRMDRLDKVYRRLGLELDRGGQAYVVVPRIRANGPGTVDVKSVFATLRQSPLRRFATAMIHGQFDDASKHLIMEQFRAGAIKILVATTVVEVGVDVPGATCMVVLSAERFGLATLHQLRGRVGRGAAQSYAFLGYAPSLTAAGVHRLQAMKQSHDGFELAELDLQQRGPGELLGLRQAGLQELRVADLARDLELARQAREVVQGGEEAPILAHHRG